LTEKERNHPVAGDTTETGVPWELLCYGKKESKGERTVSFSEGRPLIFWNKTIERRIGIENLRKKGGPIALRRIGRFI